MTGDEKKPIINKVIDDELAAISAKRNEDKKDIHNLFGIALSGGGIRSATTCAGVLRVLNKYGVFPLADYLSTVSGGGYIGGYIHAKLKDTRFCRHSF